MATQPTTIPFPLTLTLAHSGDPDDAFMWWPLTGKVHPDGLSREGVSARPRLETAPFVFRAVPGDISQFNKRAALDAPYDITALSLRAWADVAEKYVITRVGSSFGDGYGPKVVAKLAAQISRDVGGGVCDALAKPGFCIAVPGLRTTACMTMLLMVAEGSGRAAMERVRAGLVEVPFDNVIPAVLDGHADAGLVIHEGQVMFADAGLTQVVDLGVWWGARTGLPLPLGVNAVKRDLDARCGAGSLARVSDLLRESLEYALAHREESVEYTMEYAALNAANSRTPVPTRERVGRYIDMYVTGLTRDIGARGSRAVGELLRAGGRWGLVDGVREGVLELL